SPAVFILRGRTGLHPYPFQCVTIKNGVLRKEKGRQIASRPDQSPTMKKIIQVRIFKGERQYVAECLDLPVVTQAKTLDELAENLREAISLHLKGEDLAELDLAEDPSVLASFELEPLVHAKA